MEAIVLAGGLGTRLRQELPDLPKPMAPIVGRSFLEYLLLQLKKNDVRDIILSIGYRGKRIKEYFGSGKSLGLCLRYSSEPSPMGTAGALKLAEKLVRSKNFLVMNGDSYFDVNLNTLIYYHYTENAVATIALAVVENAQRYGLVEINNRGKIVRFREKGVANSGCINGGIYVFHREIFSLIPAGRAVSLEYEIFPKLIDYGFYGLPFEAYFVDIGVPEDYLKLRDDPSRLLSSVLPESGMEGLC